MLSEPSLVKILQCRAAQQPGKVVYRFLPSEPNGRIDELTYSALARKAQVIARELGSICQPGDRALLLYPPGLDFIAAFFGCLYAGIIPVPAYPSKRSQKVLGLAAIAKDAGARIALTTRQQQKTIQSRFRENEFLSQLPNLASDAVGTGEALSRPLESWQVPSIQKDTIAFLQYTSGSTGAPKGVMVSHGNLLHNQRMIQLAFGHTEKTVMVSWLPMFHDMGLIGHVVQPMYVGFPCTLMSPMLFLQHPFRWLEAISHYRATTSGGPNFAYDLCVERITSKQKLGLDLAEWNLAFSGAEPVRAETLERFSHAFSDCGFESTAFYPCYGMAEATLLVSGGERLQPPKVGLLDRKSLEENKAVWIARSAQIKPDCVKSIVGCGQSPLEQSVVIVHPEKKVRLEDNQIGEIWIQGFSVAQGYWQKSSATQQVFQGYLNGSDETSKLATESGPFLRTGDLGFMLDGELFLTGRLKELIILRGRNYYPQDIERVVQKSHVALPSNSGAAFSVEIEGREHLIVIHEVTRSYFRQLQAAEIAAADIAKSVRRAISEAFDIQVHSVVLIKPGSLLKTSSGKIKRRACRDAFINNTLNVVALDALGTFPSNSQPDLAQDAIADKTSEDLEYWMIRRLSQYLKVAPAEIDPEALFTALGIDSSIAVSMTGDLAQSLGVDLEPHLLWEYPSIESLAQYLAHHLAQPPQKDSLVTSSTFP